MPPPAATLDALHAELRRLEQTIVDMRVSYETRLARMEEQLEALAKDQQHSTELVERRLQSLVSWFKPILTAMATSIVLGLLALLMKTAVSLP